MERLQLHDQFLCCVSHPSYKLRLRDGSQTRNNTEGFQLRGQTRRQAKMRKKLIFTVLAVLLLTPWPVAYAHDNAMPGSGSYLIEAAAPPAEPAWNAFGKAIGGVTSPVDLFYIDTADSPADISVTLYLTNAGELISHYKYLILRVGVYAQTGPEQWEEATAVNGDSIKGTYITMQTGKTNFILPRYAKYKVTIDGGSFYCFCNSTGEGSVSPKFYLTAE
ncbi:hypothetical protein ACFLU9_01485 [Chloroflexota bacterium]